MHCPYCGKQNPKGALACGYCGRSFNASAPPPAPTLPNQQTTRVVVETRSTEGLFSHISGLANFILTAVALSLIAAIVLTFLCVIKLPSDFPILNLPTQLDDLWSRAVYWQSQNCF